MPTPLRALLAALLLLAAGACGPIHDDSLVIHAGTLIDGSGTVRRNCAIVIRGGRIAAIGGEQAGARSIDARDATVLPGLRDGHVHFCLTGGALRTAGEVMSPRMKIRSALLCGVTTMRSLGDDPAILAPIRSPRLLAAGPVVTGDREHPTEVIGFEKATSSAPVEGFDVVKVVHSRERTTACVEFAHRRGLRCLAHVETRDQALEALALGVDGIEHFPRGMDDDVVRALRERGATWEPTLAAEWARRADLTTYVERDDVKRSVPEAVRRSAGWGLKRDTSAMPDLSWVAKAHRAGVRISAGSDAGAAGVFFGAGLIRELELLVEAGLSPVEAIGCSVTPLRVGAPADLVIVPGDASRDITALRTPRLVLVDGAPAVLPPAEPPARWALIGDALSCDGRRVTGRVERWSQLVIEVEPRGMTALRVKARGRHELLLGHRDRDLRADSTPVTIDPDRLVTVRFTFWPGDIDFELESLEFSFS